MSNMPLTKDETITCLQGEARVMTRLRGDIWAVLTTVAKRGGA